MCFPARDGRESVFGALHGMMGLITALYLHTDWKNNDTAIGEQFSARQWQGEKIKYFALAGLSCLPWFTLPKIMIMVFSPLHISYWASQNSSQLQYPHLTLDFLPPSFILKPKCIYHHHNITLLLAVEEFSKCKSFKSFLLCSSLPWCLWWVLYFCINFAKKKSEDGKLL